MLRRKLIEKELDSHALMTKYIFNDEYVVKEDIEDLMLFLSHHLNDNSYLSVYPVTSVDGDLQRLDFTFYEIREETDDEFEQRRIKEEESKRIVQKLTEDLEYQQYLTLKAKYGKENN